MTLKKDDLAIKAKKDLEARGMGEKKENMTIVQVRFKPSDIRKMKTYFKREGLSLSAGIRRAVFKNMREEGLEI